MTKLTSMIKKNPHIASFVAGVNCSVDEIFIEAIKTKMVNKHIANDDWMMYERFCLFMFSVELGIILYGWRLFPGFTDISICVL